MTESASEVSPDEAVKAEESVEESYGKSVDDETADIQQTVVIAEPESVDVDYSEPIDAESPDEYIPAEPVVSEPVVSEPISRSVSEVEADLPDTSGLKRKRLAGDKIGKLQDHLETDALDVDSWLDLAAEFKSQGKLENVRETYEKIVDLFPLSAEIWIAYIDIELEYSEFQRAEQLFARCLTKVLKVDLWESYLGYIRRVNNDASSTDARSTIQQAYEFALGRIGNDRESGKIWLDYLHFIRSAPKSSNIDHQQLMDLTRKTYRRALCIPLRNIENIWQGYNSFENSLNKSTARKFIADRSATYMNARSCSREISNITQGIDTSTFPRSRKWNERERKQSSLWQKWIKWELKNPLGATDDVVQQRVLYTYKQAVMSLTYFSDWWYAAADYCLKKLNKIEEATEILKDGLKANPGSFMLTIKSAELYGSQNLVSEVRKVFQDLISTLEKERTRIPGGEDPSVAQDSTPVPEAGTSDVPVSPELAVNGRDISFAYTEYMKAIKRLEGIKGARKIFSEGRKLSYLTPHIYIASAMMEYHNSRESGIANKIFEIGIKRFSKDAEYVETYFDFLILVDDEPNARALFEKSVVKMTTEQQKALFRHYMKYESDYGDLTGIIKLEERYAELFPNDPPIDLFVSRYKVDQSYDPLRERDLGKRFAKIERDTKSDNDDGELRRKKVKSSSGTADLPDSIFSLLDELPPAAVYDTIAFNPKKLRRLIQSVTLPDNV